jgi:general secretion pathway protein K
VKERGVALVIVLGVVALVSSWAVTAAYEDMISLRRAENLQQSTRAWMANESALELVRFYLREDARDNHTDDLDEDWAQPIPPLPLDDGLVTGVIIDANRYFNLNDLVNDQGDAQGDAIDITKRLFTRLDLSPSLVDKLVDWIDKNDQPSGAGGAEESHYHDQPYRVKNARLDRWQELRLIDGFDDEVMEKLKQAVSAHSVPKTGKTVVNINTAEKALLMALFPKMTDVDAEGFIEQRPYEQVSSAINGKPWATGADTARLSVVSDAFIVRTDALFGRARWREEYLLTRTADGKTAIEYRERQGWME